MKVLTLDDVKTEERIPRIRVPLHENQRYIVHEIAGLDDKQDDKIRKTVTINEPVGSGKTLMVLAVHALNYRKRPYPLIRQHDGFGIIKIYPQTIIESTMVVCDGLVFDHWINEINTKTELSVCPVSNVTQLNKFINSGKLWDIVLVKNGTSPKIRDLSYLDIIVKHFGNTHWRRVVFDDITMCAFHTTYGAPFALNYIFTMSNEVDKLDAHCARAPPLMHPVLGNRSLLSCAKVLANSEIVRCSEEILGISFELPLITSNEYILDNGNAVALNLLSSLTELTADDTLKLNNDSIKGIARRLGIIAKSLADLVSRLTERNFDKMQKRAQNITLIKEALADITIHEAINDNQLHKAQNDGQLTKVTYANEDEKNQWKEVLAELENSYDEKLSKLKNVLSNMEYKECQNCSAEFCTGVDAVVVPCCQYVFCWECFFGDQKAITKCLQCGTSIDGEKVIYLPFALVEKIESSIAPETIAHAPVEEIIPRPEEYQRWDKKEDAVIHLIKTGSLGCVTIELKHTGNNILKGKLDVPFDGPKRKYIIAGVANITSMTDALNNAEIPAAQACKTGFKKQVAELEDGTIQALIFNGRTEYAGFDSCSFVTDVIIVGTLSPSIINQFIGRAHRFGKKYNTLVHLLRYNTEPPYCFQAPN